MPNGTNGNLWTEYSSLRWKVLQIILVIAAVLTGSALLYALRRLIFLLILTVVYYFLLSPLVELLEGPWRLRGRTLRVSRALSVSIVYLFLLGGLVVAFEVLVPRITDQVSAFVKRAPEYAKQVDRYSQLLASLPYRYRFPPGWRSAFGEGMNRITSEGFSWLRSFALGVVTLTAYFPWIVLIPIIGFFWLKDGPLFRRKVIELLPERDLRRRVTEFLTDIGNALAAYIKAQLESSVIVGVIVTAGLTVLGAPYSVVLGITAGLLEFIPLVGPLVIAVASVAIASFESLRLALVLVLFFAIVRFLQDYVIYPRLISREIEMHPVVVIVAVLCGAELGGVAGVFLSVPVAALLIITIRHWPHLTGSAAEPPRVEDVLKT